ncbi:restriction endonuclease subunit S [Thalassobellus suaedae]|uniref:Restriction endonuclease subunit S n=1 Tax=Thalassobellus suaedae TaxID=3074124 RepID=A0ABY9Y399_9FLAO|nr:restriction endonuclease subunit S [Flavobacteriaceae bacterium HL-DH10]
MQLLKHFKELTIHPNNAQEVKSLIVQLAIDGKLTKTSKVKHTCIGEIIEFTKNGFSGRPNDEGIGAKRLGIETVTQTDFIEVNEDMAKYIEIAEDKKDKYFVKNNDVLICRQNGNLNFVGKAGVYYGEDNQLIFSDSLIQVRPSLDIVDSSYLCIFINSKTARYQLDKFCSTTAGNFSINGTNLKKVAVPVYTLEEQKAIVEIVETLFKEVEQLEQLTAERITLKEKFVTSALNQLTTNNTKKEWAFLQEHIHDFFNETSNIKKLRETVLQLAVQGKLTQDWRSCHPELVSGSHHASELLKRIQKEKSKLIKDKKIKKEKPLPPITKDEMPYELPEGWVWCRFQEVFDIRDGTHDSPKNVSGANSYPLVTSKDFKNGEIDFESAKRISKEDYYKIIQRSLVEEDDILFSMIGGNLGNQVMVKGNTDFAIKNVALFKYYNKSLSVPDFLKTFSEHIAYAVQEKASGGAQPFVSLTFLRQMLIPLPPLEEQKAIVQKVNTLMGLCDALEQEVQQSQQQSEELMQSCLREVFN